jgi:predicted Zn-dependent peptidase
MYEIEKLKSGLTILRVPVEGVESVSVVVMARTGSRYEKVGAYGVAHFLEHMVFKGTKKYPSAKIISETVDGIGAQFNAFTGEEATAFYIRCAGKDASLAIQILGQMTTQALIEAEEIEREKGVILEEIHMYEDQPDAYNSILFGELFYQGSGLAHNILGTRESVGGMKRENFVDYLNTWYGADNLLVVLAGKKATVLKKDLTKEIEQNFAFEKSRQKHPDQNDFWENKFKYGSTVHFEQRKIEQIHFSLGWPSIDRFDERDSVLDLLSVIVGGNMSSRLFLEVRERRGLCYYINAQASYFSDTGCFGADAGVNPKKLVEAVKVTVEEFEGLSVGKKAVSEKELVKAKNFLTGQLTLAQESVHNLAISYGMRYLHEGKVKTIQERLKELGEVELEQVRVLAEELVKRKQLCLAMIGDIGEEQKKEIKKLWK